jgi:hypothetical protein
LGDLWDMVARSAFTRLCHSVLLLSATLAGVALVFLATDQRGDAPREDTGFFSPRTQVFAVVCR